MRDMGPLIYHLFNSWSSIKSPFQKTFSSGLALLKIELERLAHSGYHSQQGKYILLGT